jgi:hypothetical protein
MRFDGESKIAYCSNGPDIDSFKKINIKLQKNKKCDEFKKKKKERKKATSWYKSLSFLALFYTSRKVAPDNLTFQETSILFHSLDSTREAGDQSGCQYIYVLNG